MNDTNQIGQVSRAPSLEEERNIYVPRIKALRQEIDGLIRRLERPKYNQESNGKEVFPCAFETRVPVDQARVKLIEAKMWAGKILEALGNPFPPELADNAK